MPPPSTTPCRASTRSCSRTTARWAKPIRRAPRPTAADRAAPRRPDDASSPPLVHGLAALDERSDAFIGVLRRHDRLLCDGFVAERDPAVDIHGPVDTPFGVAQ